MKVSSHVLSSLSLSQQGDAEVFNGYLRHIKEELQGTRYAAFWEDKVTGEGVTLISSSELSSCSVSPEQAAQVNAVGGWSLVGVARDSWRVVFAQ